MSKNSVLSPLVKLILNHSNEIKLIMNTKPYFLFFIDAFVC
ncbi:unnamed protein product, partial [marine sediment metagenome]